MVWRLLKMTLTGRPSKITVSSLSAYTYTEHLHIFIRLWFKGKTFLGENRVGFFTTRDVKRGEELNFDYKYERYGQVKFYYTIIP